MIAQYAKDTTRDNPWSLSFFSRKFSQHIANAPATWIEAEVVSIKRYSRAVYLTLKDLNDEAFLPASSFVPEIIAKLSLINQGSRIVFNAKPAFWVKRGELTMTVQDVQEVGIGDMLMRIEQLKQQLATEGLFEQQYKCKLPFIPQLVGLICGKNAQAKDDILQKAIRRWPNVKFEIREVSVGNSPNTPKEVIQAMKELDAHEQVDVIVIARGGGALEEVVFPFSDEQLVRAVFAVTTPIVSAIGHETDTPILDYVADFRASTPTDAVNHIVPNWSEEVDIIEQLQLNITNNLLNQLEWEQQLVNNLTSRPILHTPAGIIEPLVQNLGEQIARLRFSFAIQLERENAQLQAQVAKVNSLSPRQTMHRGYSIVYATSAVVKSSKSNVKNSKANSFERRILKNMADFKPNERIKICVVDGEIGAKVETRSK